MRRTDEGSIAFAANWYKTNIFCGDEQFTVATSSTENYDCDFAPFCPDCGEFHVELKTKNCPYNEWSISTTGSCLFFGLVPPIEKDIDKVSRLWTLSKPTQAQIQAEKHAEHESGSRVRWFCLNAASGEDFLFGNTFGYAPIKPPKWLGMFRDEKSELLILFSDGVLRFDHQQLLDAQASYGYLYTWGSEEYYRSSGKYWQFKIFFDIDKGTFYPCEVPQEILPRAKKYN